MATEQEQKIAQEKLAAEKLNAERNKPQMPNPATEVPREFKIGESTGNITRDSIIDMQRAKFVESGKDEAEAQKLAVKRGFEMIKEEEPKK